MRLQPATAESTNANDFSDAVERHAELAMDAARRVRRARRKSQKEKMGHAVCHHLLCLLSAEPAPTAREVRLETGIVKRRPPQASDDRQYDFFSSASL